MTFTKKFVGCLTAAGLLASGVNGPVAAGDVKYKYDALGRMIEADYDTANKVDQYCYDALGNRLERIISTSGGTCPTPGGPGGGGGPIQITSPGTFNVLPAHQSVYGCTFVAFMGIFFEYCFLQSNNVIVFTRDNGNPATDTHDPGYSGLLEVTSAAYGTGVAP